MGTERLQKILARAGLASRRSSEELITEGRVKVNGEVVHELGISVDLAADDVQVDDQPLPPPEKHVYILLHKPVGVVSTADDPQSRETVLDLVDVPERVFPVGRLDIDSAGLLLLTNDGVLTHTLTHPRYEVEKEYHALLDRTPDKQAIAAWRNGVQLDDRPTAPAQVTIIEETDRGTWVRVVLHEGRKRQIREVARVLGYQVGQLIRVREGNIRLGDLPPGEWRTLTPAEVASLSRHATTGGTKQSADEQQPGAGESRRRKPAPTREWHAREEAKARMRQERFSRRQPRSGSKQQPRKESPNRDRRDRDRDRYRQQRNSSRRTLPDPKHDPFDLNGDS